MSMNKMIKWAKSFLELFKSKLGNFQNKFSQLFSDAEFIMNP